MPQTGAAAAITSGGHWVMAQQVLLHLGAADIADVGDAKSMVVVHPHGEEILRLVGQRQSLMKDAWLKFTFGPVLLHSGTRGPEWWTNRVSQSGFHIMEQGTQPGTLWILARKQ